MKYRSVIEKAKKDIIILQLLFVLVFLVQIKGYANGGVMNGSGTSGSPYLVQDYADLRAIGTGSYTLSAIYRLANDIDASASDTANGGTGFSPIGSLSPSYLPFIGTFHGGGHVIKNLYINNPVSNYIGLFGYSGAIIDSLGVTKGIFIGGSYVGGVAGYNFGSIINCYATGRDSSSDVCVGGIAGTNNNYGTISQCYSTASISGFNKVGGIVGENDNTITNCYETGNVNGSTWVGGIAGYNSDTISYCYEIGYIYNNNNNALAGGVVGYNPGSITLCYWNTQTSGDTSGCSGIPNSASSGTGLTTAQMKQSSSFSGWNFTTIWFIGPTINNGFPYLGSNIPTSVEKGINSFAPKTFSLLQNFPNPFNPSTTISFTIPSRSFVSLKVFDIVGREVAIILSEEMPEGSYAKQWNAEKMSSGIYFCRMQAGSFTATKKLILLK